ncbi:MAG: hypothetical protein IPP74_15495 [Alphaproteobacteria bacterium]|nr:hypothetical protein [Alphaproteobacteria bacterium]
MAVDDHGIEALKKSAEEVVPGSKADYYLKTGVLLNGEPISDTNPLPVSGGASKTDTATITQQAASISSVTLLLSNPDRLGFVVYNESSSVAYLAFGPVASPTLHTYAMAPSSVLREMPSLYTGEVTCIWITATGSMKVTEL